MLTGLWRIIDDDAKYREAKTLIAEEIERLNAQIDRLNEEANEPF